jgi:ABC-2 type transport system ATP-binding protein
MIDMRDLIARIAAQHRTVLLSSHLLSELERICDWLFIIEEGRLVYAGRFDEFASDTGTDVLLDPVRSGDLISLAAVIADEGLDVRREGHQLVVPVGARDPRQLAGSLNSSAARAGIVLAQLHVRRPNLEANYLRLLEGDVA